MKKFIYLLLLFVSCNSQTTTNLDHMTPQLWEKDLDFLNKKIQREFATFYPDIKSDFDTNINQLKSKLPELNNSEIAISIGQLLAKLRDGHTELSILQSNANFNRLPIALYFFNEGLYIYAAHEAYSAHIGSRITHIEDTPISDVFNQLKTIMTYDNDYEILHAGPSYIGTPKVLSFLGVIKDENTIRMTLEKDTSDTTIINIESVSISQYNEGPWLYYLEMNNIERPLKDKHSDKYYWFEYLDADQAMYFNFKRTSNQKGQPSIKKTVSNLFKEIDKVKAKKLIIDLRNNNGGNYNKSRPLIKAIKEHEYLNKKGNVFVITGRRTFSAAMVTSIFLKQETNAQLVGEISRAHPNKCDNNEYLELPNSKLSVEYTTKVKKHWSELGDLDHVPVDKEIPVRFADYKIGVDPVMNYILSQ